MRYFAPKSIKSLFIAFALLGCFGTKAVSQPITGANDGTGTQVTPSTQNPNQFNIGGGTAAGANLFHSFDQFGLNAGQIANFLSNPNIQNILGRVTGGNASVINGLIQVSGGNSNLYLINPAGIIFGSNASLNVPASFTATTANRIGFGENQWLRSIGNNDYASLTSVPSSFAFVTNGGLFNAGNLTVGQGQSITLMGGTVVNTGTIAAPGGRVTIAAVPNQKLVRVSQAGSVLSLDLPTTETETLTPRSLPELLTGGTLSNASKATVENGVIKISGQVSVAGETPGKVQILGDRIDLTNANINASSAIGGGTVLIGGEAKGQGDTPRARSLHSDAQTTISADAARQGTGGEIILWSEDSTRVQSRISARGIDRGGFVETSGRENLNVNGAIVDASTTKGDPGTWLLDPTDINIADTGGTITPAAIAASLDAGTNVSLTTAGAGADVGDITLTDSINQTGGGTASLTLTGRRLLRPGSAVFNLSTTGDLTLNLNQVNPETTVPTSALSTAIATINNVVGNRIINLGAGTYIGGTLSLTSRLTIRGTGTSTILDGGNARQVVSVGAGADVTLENLTIANGLNPGNTGGGIVNNGTLAVNHVTIRNNSAGFGGGIYNFNTLRVNDSTVSNNSATSGNGGGILSLTGTATINNSTFSGNSTVSSGGGLRIAGGAATVSNSTFSSNSATSNGGGISLNASATLRNNIVAGNTAPTGREVSATSGTTSYNLFGFSSNSGLSGLTPAATDIIPAVPLNQILNTTLANNGGSTQTLALVAGSPAIDAGDPTSTLTLDQRGAERAPTGVNAGTRIDVGAYEATSSYGVTNTRDDSSIGTLRSALTFSNINTNPVTNNPQDTIRFNIGTVGSQQTIAPTAALPTITESVILDGWSQGGTSYSGVPLIELDGTNAGTTNGLTINANNSSVQGLVINRFTQSGIAIAGNNVILQGNYIGTDITGTLARGNRENGIRLQNVAGVRIGTDNDSVNDAAERNLISGNLQRGILAVSNVINSAIAGNYIGTDVTGTRDLGNTFAGIFLQNNSSDNTISGNVISGNDRQGNVIGGSNANVQLFTSSNNNRFVGNLIGTNATGTGLVTNAPFPNGGVRGILISGSSGTIIGGTNASDRNIISGNLHTGVEPIGNATGSQIIGNYIGTDITGNTALGNGNFGIQLWVNSSNTTIRNNVISGNGQVVTGSGQGINVESSNNNTIAGNRIGTNAAGTAALSNERNGIRLNNSANNTIGGTSVNDRNLISGNGRIGDANFDRNGITISGASSSNNQILNNYIGTDITGTTAISNGSAGILINNAPNTVIGSPNAGNLISGNSSPFGGIIAVFPSTTNTSIQGNLIGTDATGTLALPNAASGIYLQQTSGNLIGSNNDGNNDAAERNIISGNTLRGIHLNNAVLNNTIAGNYIGTDITGTLNLGNGFAGILLNNNASNNIIRNNTISGNDRQGNAIGADNANIQIVGSSGNRLVGNFIGTNATGTGLVTNAPFGNGGVRGISIQNSSSNIVGGTINGDANVISGNLQAGVEVITGATNNQILGNRIGTDLAGTAAIGNGNAGIRLLQGSSNTTIADNLIAGNGQGVTGAGHGVQIVGSSNNQIVRNTIGINTAGATNLGNTGDGIEIAAPTGSATNNTIGGTTAGDGNTIAYNAQGVSLAGNATTGNRILGNSIYSNLGKGINLTGTTTSNPIGTNPSTGANNLQNYPVITSASGTSVQGFLNSAANTNYRIEFFSTPVAGAGVVGYQGRTFLGTTNVTTDATGTINFTATTSTIPPGQVLSATATNLTTGDTSEFSPGAPNAFTFVGGNNQNTTVNTAFANPLQVSVTDLNNNPVSLISVGFTAPTTGASAVFTSPVRTNALGIASLPVTANTISGTYNVNSNLTGFTSIAFNLTNNPDVATRFSVFGFPSPTIAGQSQNFTVTALDQFNNIATGYAGTIAFSSDDAQAVLPGNSTLTAGTGSFSGELRTAGTRSITATDTVTASITGSQTGIVINPANPFAINAIAGTPQSTTVNTAFPTVLEVEVRDRFGNVVPNSTVTFNVPSSGASVGLSTSSITTDASGRGSVSASANTIAGTYNATGSVTGVTTPATFSLTNTPGTVTRFDVTGFPSTITAGNAGNFTVTAFDAFNNLATNYTGTISFSSTDPGGTLPGTSALANGTGTFSATLITAGTRSLTASDPSLSVSGTQTGIVVNPAAPNTLSVIDGSNQSTIVNTAFNQALQVLVRDRFGNVVPNAIVQFITPTTGASGRPDNQTTTTDANGIAQVNFTANTIAGAFSAEGTIQGVNNSARFSLTNLADRPAQVLLNNNNQSTPVRRAFSRPLQATILDQFGNPVPGSVVTFTLPNQGASGRFTNGLQTITVNTNTNGITQVRVIANDKRGDFVGTATVLGVAPVLFNFTNLTGFTLAEEIQFNQDFFGRVLPKTQNSPLDATPLLCAVRSGDQPKTLDPYQGLPDCSDFISQGLLRRKEK